jgi:tetratricopeptide (TPR) repeat protein
MEEFDEEEDDDLTPAEKRALERRNKRSAVKDGKPGKPIPLTGLVIAAGILLASAGGTFFFLSRPPESDRLLTQGQKELANGQYAFAQKTLEQAMALKPSDPQILLTLSRAYVGTDQVEKAWRCISLAQQSGTGVLSAPQLASDLAKYYTQRNQYQRAAELLRPLAGQNVPQKKAELSDLDALWGDECFNKGDTEQALKCWEEVKSLGEGARVNEVDTRLATIYSKMANEFLSKDDLDGALRCLNNLNTIAPSPQSFEKSADLYAKQGKLDLAIDQIHRAIKQGSGSRELNKKLAGFLSKRGKELLDAGDAETGYAYLQQAQGYDSNMKVPSVALRSINVNVDNLSGTVRCSGEAWNPGTNSVSYLSVRCELYDTKSSQAIWSKEQKVVDEFVPPMQQRETRQFELSGPLTAVQEGLEVRIYLNGNLYKSYPLSGPGGRPAGTAAPTGNPPGTPTPGLPTLNPIRQPQPTQTQTPPPLAPPVVPQQQPPRTNIPGGMTPEERTLRDLD